MKCIAVVVLSVLVLATTAKNLALAEQETLDSKQSGQWLFDNTCKNVPSNKLWLCLYQCLKLSEIRIRQKHAVNCH